MFLSVVRLPNLKVASLLLSLAFLYDVFFVFISPYFFSSSVMISVATGGDTATHDDENYCEKYPDDVDCESTTLPMLLIVPSISTYYSSESILGLGDIVLPGLLAVWAARYDLRRYGTLQSEQASKGYFPMVMFGYAAGLMAANFAVSYFEYGQPALLYIVPLTLGPVLYRACKSETVWSLWSKLPPMKTIAFPLDREEQRALLSRTDVVEAVASWRQKGGMGVVVLGGLESVDDGDYGEGSSLLSSGGTYGSMSHDRHVNLSTVEEGDEDIDSDVSRITDFGAASSTVSTSTVASPAVATATAGPGNAPDSFDLL